MRIATAMGLLAFLLPAWAGVGAAFASEPGPSGPLRLSRMADDTGTIRFFGIVEEAYRRLGVTVVAEPLPPERALQAADHGLTDGDTVRVEGIEAFYPNLVRVPEPVAHVDVTAFTTGLSFPVQGWESLRPYTVCYMHGLKLHEQGTSGMRRMGSDGQENAVRLLRDGQCEVAVLSANAWIMIDTVNAGPMRELEPPIARHQLYHYVHRRHAAIVPRLAEELRKMRQEGVIDAILEPGREAARQAKARQSMP